MSRSLSNLRRGLLGIAVAGSLGFGTTQAFATVDRATTPWTCDPTNPWENGRCASLCQSTGHGNAGYCSHLGECLCGYEP